VTRARLASLTIDALFALALVLAPFFI